MLFGVSGTHGTGKSTLLRALLLEGAKVFPSMYWHQTSLSRDVQTQLGISLDDFIGNSSLMIRFQEEVMTNLIFRDFALTLPTAIGPSMVERTPVDLLTYAAMWLQKNGDMDNYADWFELYTARCVDAMRRYTGIIVIEPSIPFVAEAQRASGDTRDECASSLLKHLDALNKPEHEVQVLIISSSDMDVRVHQSLNFILDQ